jgi:hypothetical protein
VNSCAHCPEPVRLRILFEFVLGDGGHIVGQRPVEVWVHEVSSHERCHGRDTFAEPKGKP